ncbi:hypothetical protein [Phenylobacterium soli]|uniref:Uncharacterized protein n=1 Tax=Phenylobacterium soli TaxID=2170551 RepID=A0A328A9I4_9CAUL|nr:hypothetical protein [Phenylobacterium soli]RAK51189.1 hypothetical protein DJ017_19720 [Phenylobacterium soli]
MHERLDELFEELASLKTDVGAIKAKVLAYDILKDRAKVAITTAGVFIAVIWWLIKSRIAALFGAQP